MGEPAIEQLLTREDENRNHQHRREAEDNAKTTDFRRILQALKREKSNGRYAGCGNARDPFWDGQPGLTLFSIFLGLWIQFACMESDPGNVSNGDGERKIP